MYVTGEKKLVDSRRVTEVLIVIIQSLMPNQMPGSYRWQDGLIPREVRSRPGEGGGISGYFACSPPLCCACFCFSRGFRACSHCFSLRVLLVIPGVRPSSLGFLLVMAAMVFCVLLVAGVGVCDSRGLAPTSK